MHLLAVIGSGGNPSASKVLEAHQARVHHEPPQDLMSLGDWLCAGGHGRGSLLNDANPGLNSNEASPAQDAGGDADGVRLLDPDQLVSGRYQPRQQLDETYLHDLEQSIRRFGVTGTSPGATTA